MLYVYRPQESKQSAPCSGAGLVEWVSGSLSMSRGGGIVYCHTTAAAAAAAAAAAQAQAQAALANRDARGQRED